MENPQTAASLFGDDPTSDPFAVIGTESAQDTTTAAASTENDDFFASGGEDTQSDYTPSSAAQAAYAAYGQPSTTWNAPVTNAQHDTRSYETAQRAYEGAYTNGYGGAYRFG